MSTIELILAIAGVGAIPWATWVSKTLWNINQHTVGLAARTESNERRIDELENLLPRHIPTP